MLWGRVPFVLLGIASVRVPAGQADLEASVRKARTERTVTRAEPPDWMDEAKVRSGYGFLVRRMGTVFKVYTTSSLAATFAAKDVAPVLMKTGRLPEDFSARMQETVSWMGAILSPPKDRADFVAREYAKAVDLGRLHASVGEAVRAGLRWNPKERLPMNGQSTAFVLYTFAWWPVESMLATKSLDPVKDSEALDGWFHLWSVLGYGMGVPESLLPRDYARAAALAPILKAAQYARKGEAVPAGCDVLLGGNVRYLEAGILARAKTRTEGAPEAQAVRREAASTLASQIALSSGLAEALGLRGSDPVEQLVGYASRGG